LAALLQKVFSQGLSKTHCRSVAQGCKCRSTEGKEGDPSIDGVGVFPLWAHRFPRSQSLRPVVGGEIDWTGPDGKSRQVDADERHSAHSKLPGNAVRYRESQHDIGN
jgi:hypothetical protein